jgi:hypothetical protein
MPQRIEDTLLVVASFKDRNGTEYLPGDRLPIRHRWVRQLAAEQPELFVMEFATEPVDLDWLSRLGAMYEERYLAAKRARDGQEERRQRALRQEMEEQEAPQPELERGFKQQEKERKRREQEAREEREREALEREIELAGDLRSGFNY